MGHRSFSAAKADAALEPITFDVDGTLFTVPRPVPILPVIDLAALAVNTDGGGEEALAAFSDTLAAMLGPAQYRTFKRLPIGFEQLLEIVQYLVGEAVGRPTPPSDSSPTSSSTGGQSSTASSPATAPPA